MLCPAEDTYGKYCSTILTQPLSERLGGDPVGKFGNKTAVRSNQKQAGGVIHGIELGITTLSFHFLVFHPVLIGHPRYHAAATRQPNHVLIKIAHVVAQCFHFIPFGIHGDKPGHESFGSVTEPFQGRA